MTLGERMLTYRARHNISQRELADLLGTYDNNVSRIELGKHKPHRANELKFNLKMNELEGNENEQM